MDFDVSASTWMPLPPRQFAVTLTFDLQNIITSNVEVCVILFMLITYKII